jgi:hypothetical protein
MKLIAFTGQMGSGKSTAVSCLRDLYSGPIINIKFAQPLYDIQDLIYNRLNLKRPTKDRKLLQWIGTDWGRELDQDMWIKIWKEEVIKQSKIYPHALITCDDCRYDNEAATVKDLGGSTVLMETKLDRIEKINSTHISENGIDAKFIDATILNNGSRKDLTDTLQYLNELSALW